MTERRPLSIGGCLLMVHLFASQQQTPVAASIEATPASNTEDGACVCTVKLPPVIVCTDYVAQDNADKLQDIQNQVSKLARDVEKLDQESSNHQTLAVAFESKLSQVTSTFDVIQGGKVPDATVLEAVRAWIQKMDDYLAQLKEWQRRALEDYGAGHVERIQDAMLELSNINQTVAAMVAQGTSEDLPAMQRRISTLRSQLKSCNAKASSGGAGDQSTPTPGHLLQTTVVGLGVPTVATITETADDNSMDGDTLLPERWPTAKKQNSCSRLLRVTEPYTVRGNLGEKAGTWMRDPVVNTDLVYYQAFSSRSNMYGQLSGSVSVKSFQKGEANEVTLRTISGLKDSITYNGSLYAYSGDTSYEGFYGFDRRPALTKSDWSKTTQFTFNSDPRPTQSTFDSYPYSRATPQSTFDPYRHSRATPQSSFNSFARSTGGYDEVRRTLTSADIRLDRFGYAAASAVPKADLTLDESGLWVLYGNSLGTLAASKLDHDTLEVQQTWEGSFPKNRVGNCFIICGRVYCIDRSSGFEANVSYFMDTASRTEGFVKIPIILKYGSLSSLEYNPGDQLLYGVDDGHAVVYQLIFED